MTGFEGIGDFDSDDPMQRYLAHQAAKGNLVPIYEHKWGPQHYNALAKEIREQFPIDPIGSGIFEASRREENMTRRGTLANLALSLAKRFVKDNEDFDPLTWLDQCSPDTDLYPISELWEK